MGWLKPAPAEEVESPCIGVCTLDDDGLCMGCRRSADEIAAWLDLSPEQRSRIIEDLESRTHGR